MNYLSIKIFSIYTYVMYEIYLVESVVKFGNISLTQGLFFYIEFALHLFRGFWKYCKEITKSADTLCHAMCSDTRPIVCTYAYGSSVPYLSPHN